MPNLHTSTTSDNPALTRFLALTGLVATFLDHPTLTALDLTSRALQAAWSASERLPEDDRSGATRVLWEGERGLAQARRSLLALDPTRGLIPPPPSHLTSAETLAGAALTLARCGAWGDARLALELAWPALARACREAADPPRQATVARALRDVEETLDEVAPVANTLGEAA